jgi:hypothetical protein
MYRSAIENPLVFVKNYCTPSSLKYALTKKPVGNGTTM